MGLKFVDVKVGEMFAVLRPSGKIQPAIYRRVHAKAMPPTNVECHPMIAEDGTECRGHIDRGYLAPDIDVILATPQAL